MIAVIVGIITKTPGTTAAKTISIAAESACAVRRKRYDLFSVQAEQQIRTFEASCEYFGTVSSR